MKKPFTTNYDAMTNSQNDREMTDDEFAEYLEMQKNSMKLGVSDDSEQPT